MKIGLYGGSFNPPHLGHKKVAKYVVESLNLDKLLVIPDYLPPHKELSDDAPSPEDRLNMCHVGFDYIDKVEVSDIEILRGGRSYTLDTIKKIRKVYPEDELFLVIGSDMLLSFTEWYRYEEILKECTLAVVSRTGDDIEELQKALFENSVLISYEPIVISSTEIRKDIEKYKCFLDIDVYNYIKEHKLYSETSVEEV